MNLDTITVQNDEDETEIIERVVRYFRTSYGNLKVIHYVNGVEMQTVYPRNWEIVEE